MALNFHRHGRARRGHPRLQRCAGAKDVDGRNKSGHDGKRLDEAANGANA
jgi:hypothetical protein